MLQDSHMASAVQEVNAAALPFFPCYTLQPSMIDSGLLHGWVLPDFAKIQVAC